jgi:predicted GNAT family N-acyltransferase
MDRAAEIARTMNACDIELHAQLSAKPFYARLGYREEGDVFDEAGITHVTMRKAIVP